MNSNDSRPSARRSNDRVDGAGGDHGRPLRSLKFYTIMDVAEMLGVSGRTVCRWIAPVRATACRLHCYVS
jgi:hypothetical protein